MYKDGTTFSSLFDHLSKEEKDYYDGTFAPSKNAENDWSFSDESLKDMLNKAENIVGKFRSGEIDPDKAGQDLYAIYALLTDANFKKEAKQIAKIAHDVYHDDNLGEWDDEYIPDEKLEQIKKDLKNDLESDGKITVEEYSPADGDFVKYVKKVYGDGPFTVEELKEIEKNEYDRFFDDEDGIEELDSILNESEEEPKSTNVGGIAKALTANDLGRSL